MKTYRILYHQRIRAEDGQAVHIRELIGALRAAGHEVFECALVPKANGNGVASADIGRLWQKLHLPRAVAECTEILYSKRGAAMIRRAAAGFRPDFVYERHALHCRAALDAARAIGVPLLLEVNSPLCDEMEKLESLRFRNLARRTERTVLAGADRVLSVSDVLARRLVDLGAPPDRVRVIRNGAEPARSSAETRAVGLQLRNRLGATNGLVLGFVGYMRPWHELDLVLDAMARVGRRDLHLLLAGDGPALAELVAHAAAVGLQDQVHALGRVRGHEVPGVCAAFDLALVPAINDYASPLKLFDSLAAGIPTLALDQPNIREIVRDGHTAVLFRPGDVESLAECLARVASDRERVRAIGAAGRDALLANDWTWSGNAKRVIEAFEELHG